MIGSIAILIVLAISVIPLPGAGTRGQDPTGASEAANPYDIDSDGDGISDGDEIASGHDPASNQSHPPRWICTSRYGAGMATPPFIRADWDPALLQTINFGEVTASTLAGYLATLPFPELAPETPILPAGYSIIPGTAQGDGPEWGAQLGQTRCWLQTKPASSVEIKKPVLRITTGFREPNGQDREEIPQVIGKLDVVIPANSTQSLPIDLLPPFGNFPDSIVYEHITTSLVPVEVSWKAINGFDNVDDHVDPWGKPIHGKRIFPDFKKPDATVIQNKLEVIVKTSPALAGKAILVKAFDVDDSTSEDFDTDSDTGNPVIDPIGKAGDDNLVDYLGTPKNGQFWTGAGWGSNTAEGVVDANGETKFIFKVGMQPGSNYRVVASVIDESMYDGVQTTNSAAPKYLGNEAYQNGEAPASPLLTVWRRLWVENDSMGAIPTDTFGYKRNDLSHDLTPPVILTKLSDGTNTSFGIPAITDRSSFLNLTNGQMIVQSTENPVIGTTLFGNTHFVQISGDLSNVPLGSGFRLYDDDDFGLDAAPLPRNDLVDELMKSFFKPSFIEIIDSGAFNTRKTVLFRINDDLQSSTVVNSSKDLPEQDALWVCPLTAAYQHTYEEDSDPLGEEPTFGGTRQFSNYDHSTVFVETCRDQYDQSFRVVAQGGNPQIGVNARIDMKDYTSAIATHEMGHQPGNISGDAEHEEGGIMEGRPLKMGIDPQSPRSVVFSAKSVLRFRKSHHWSKK